MGALDRYVSPAVVDGPLAKRLQGLKPDVNCWSVLTMPGAVLANHLRAGVLDDAGVTLLHGLRGVTVGVHYGSKERVDFAFTTDTSEAATALATYLGDQPHLLSIADGVQTHFEGVSVERNEVRGSVRVKDKEFDTWLEAVYARLSVDGGANGDEVARAGGVR